MIKQIVKEFDGSYSFSAEDEDEKSVSFVTRENGDTMNEEAGEEDIINARKLRSEIKEKFPEAKVSIDECDEWVFVNVRI